MTPAEQKRARHAEFNAKMRESFQVQLKSQLTKADSSAIDIWFLSACVFNGTHSSTSTLDSNTNNYPNLKCKYAHVQTYANVMNLNSLNLSASLSVSNLGNSGQLPLELNTSLVEPNQMIVSVNKQHIHALFAVNPLLNLSVPLVREKQAKI